MNCFSQDEKLQEREHKANLERVLAFRWLKVIWKCMEEELKLRVKTLTNTRIIMERPFTFI